MNTITKKVTKAQAQKVLAAVRRAYPHYVRAGSLPTLVMDWDWLGHGASPAIVWEDGPDDWAIRIEQPVDGVFCEAITSWSLGIYPDF